MKFLLVSFTIVVVLSATSAIRLRDVRTSKQTRGIEDQIRSIVSCVSDALKNGIPDQGIPAVDPIQLSSQTFNPNNEFVSGKITLTDFFAQGFSDIDIPKLSGSIGIFPPAYYLDYGFSLPKVVARGKYDMAVKLMDKDIFGNGEFEFQSNNFNMDGSLRVKVFGMVMDQFHMELSLGSSSLKITGFMNDPTESDAIGEWVTNNLPQWFQDNKERLSQIIHDMVMGTVRTYEVQNGPTDPDAILYETLISLNEILEAIMAKCV